MPRGQIYSVMNDAIAEFDENILPSLSQKTNNMLTPEQTKLLSEIFNSECGEFPVEKTSENHATFCSLFKQGYVETIMRYAKPDVWSITDKGLDFMVKQEDEGKEIMIGLPPQIEMNIIKVITNSSTDTAIPTLELSKKMDKPQKQEMARMVGLMSSLFGQAMLKYGGCETDFRINGEPIEYIEKLAGLDIQERIALAVKEERYEDAANLKKLLTNTINKSSSNS